MATKRAPDFQQSISDVTPNTYIKQGVVDKSEGLQLAADINLTKGLVKTGIDAYKAYDKQSALADITEQLNQLEQERQDRSLQGVQNLQEGLAANEQQREVIKKEAGYDNTYPMMLNTDLNNQVQGINKSIDEQATKLMKAKEQGIMSEFELGERLAKITREALTRNPAYADEISAHVGKISNVLNITARVKEDVNTIKKQQELMDNNIKKLETTAIDLGISPWNSKYQTKQGTDYEALMRDVNIGLAIKERKVNLGNIKDARVSANFITADDYVNSGDWSLDQEAFIGDFNDKALSILNDTSSRNKQLLLNDLEKNTLIDLNQTLHNVGLSGDNERLKDGVAFIKESIKDLKNDFKLYASGKMEKEELENKIATLKSTGILNVANDFRLKGKDYWKYQVFQDNLKDFPEALKAQYYPSLWTDLNSSNYTLNTEDGIDTANNLIKDQPHLGNKSSLKVFTDGVWNKAKDNEAFIPKFGETLDKHNRILANEGLSQTQGVKATRDLISSLQDPYLRDVNNKIDPTTLAITNQNVLDYTQVLENNVKSYIDSNPNLKLETIRRDDGTIQIKGLRVGSTFARGVRQINETFRAFYNTSGMSLEQAANEFYANIPSLGLGQTTSQKP